MFLLTISFCELTNSSYGQVIETESDIPENFTEIEGYWQEDSWYYFNNGLDSNLSTNVFSTFKSDFELTEYDEITLVENQTDKMGLTHTLYAQMYKGIPVDGSMISTHKNGGVINKINGNFGKNLTLEINPTVSEGEALEISLNIINADLYAWEDSIMEAQLHFDLESVEASYFPIGELVISKGYSVKDSIYHLAWKFTITSLEPEYNTIVIFINAQDGSLLKMRDRRNFCNGVVGSGNTHYGERSFDARQQGIFGTIFTLEDCERGGGIHTKKYDGSGSLNWANTDESNGHDGGDDPWWGTTEIESATTHWLVEETHDCFQDNFDRPGWDGDGNQKLRVISEIDGVVAFADYNGPSLSDIAYLYIGYHPITEGSMAITDVIGHEYSHLFINSELDWLDGNAEAASLNEGFADMFANYVEQYITGDPYDYLLGEDENIDRRMDDPTLLGDPDTYEGDLWDFSTTPNTGTNSGPIRKMFFLLANGGTHPASNITVTAIGPEDAIQIAYSVIENHYIDNDATYSTARTGFINAAVDMFGECSVQARQVARAFAAIGVGPSIRNGAACVVIEAPPAYCEEEINEFDIVFTAQFLPATSTVSWTVPSGWSYTLSGTGNSICTITHVNNASTQTISATVTTAFGPDIDNHIYDFEDCIPEGCPPLCRFEDGKLELGDFQVFPNPASDYLLIKSDNFKPNLHFTVFNSLSNEILEGFLSSDDYLLNVKDLPSGLYYLTITDETQNVLFKLFIE